MSVKALEELRRLADEWADTRRGYGPKERMRDIADEIEREHAQRVAELNGAVCERDGRIATYERRNTELNDALKAICNRFGVSTQWSAEDAAKKVLEALERDYMLLPKDADGVPIHVGETVYGKYLKGNPEYTVRGFSFDQEHGQWNVQVGDAMWVSLSQNLLGSSRARWNPYCAMRSQTCRAWVTASCAGSSPTSSMW